MLNCALKLRDWVSGEAFLPPVPCPCPPLDALELAPDFCPSKRISWVTLGMPVLPGLAVLGISGMLVRPTECRKSGK